MNIWFRKRNLISWQKEKKTNCSGIHSERPTDGYIIFFVINRLILQYISSSSLCLQITSGLYFIFDVTVKLWTFFNVLLQIEGMKKKWTENSLVCCLEASVFFSLAKRWKWNADAQNWERKKGKMTQDVIV